MIISLICEILKLTIENITKKKQTHRYRESCSGLKKSANVHWWSLEFHKQYVKETYGVIEVVFSICHNTS